MTFLRLRAVKFNIMAGSISPHTLYEKSLQKWKERIQYIYMYGT